MNQKIVRTFFGLMSCLVQLLFVQEAPAGEKAVDVFEIEAKSTSLFAAISGSNNFAAVNPGPLVVVDLRYATKNNFAEVNLYGNFNRCYLHREAAQKLETAAGILGRTKPGWKLLVLDCLRPRQIQERLYQKVRGTPQQSYVADPKKGSIHNYGFAVDLSLLDEKGIEVDMGTSFDAFDLRSRPAMEARFLKAGKLTEKQVENRLVLRSVMEKSGFIQLPIEWWHFDAAHPAGIRKNYKIIE